MHRLFLTALLSLLGGALLAIEPTSSPVARDGTPATCDLPASQHMRNTGGMGPRGPGSGAGLCVFTSFEITSRWQNGPMAGFQKWMTTKPGGGDPKKLQQMVTAFCREKGIKEPDYVQHTGGDMSVLDTAMKTRRLVCVTYAGADDFYRGGIDHMVCLAHLDATHAAIIDNNRPGAWVWMTRAEFEVRWKARGGGWAVVFLGAPPPPASARAQGAGPCVCGDGCSCPPADCPARCPVLQLQPGRYSPTCPNGRCCAPPTFVPAPVTAPPAAADVTFADKSASSLLVTREMGGGRSECGTGTVVQCSAGTSLVLTNAHVAEDGTRPITVSTAAGRVHRATYVAGSRVTHTGPTTIAVDGPDLALLSVSAELPAVALAESPPAVGTGVCLWGYGRRTNGGPTHKTGVTLDKENYSGPVQRSTIASENGDSGSGVFDAQGRLVAVHWGGSTAAFAVRLDAVKEFLKPHLVGAAVGEAAPEDDAGENHGINRPELERHTKDGKRTYWINGREVGRPQALDAVAAGGLGLVDDSDRYHLSVVTTDPAAARAALAAPQLAAALGRAHVQVYAPTDWPVASRGLKPGLTLQEPAPKGGRVLWTADAVDGASLAEALKRADPAWKPEPPAPVMPAPVPPALPAPSAPADPAPPAVSPPAAPRHPTDYTGLVALALAAIAAAVALFRR